MKKTRDATDFIKQLEDAKDDLKIVFRAKQLEKDPVRMQQVCALISAQVQWDKDCKAAGAMPSNTKYERAMQGNKNGKDFWSYEQRQFFAIYPQFGRNNLELYNLLNNECKRLAGKDTNKKLSGLQILEKAERNIRCDAGRIIDRQNSEQVNREILEAV